MISGRTWSGGLTRNSHRPTAAGAHLPESTAPGSDKGLDVLYKSPARFVSRAPGISGHLRVIASRSGEKCGLIELEGAALYRSEIE